MKKNVLLLLATALWSTCFLLSGCAPESTPQVDRGRVKLGNEQCALPGEPFAETLRIEFSGAPRQGVLGAGQRPPVPNLEVHFEPAPGSQLRVTPAVARTDAGGCVAVKVTAGNRVGDQYLRVIPRGFPEKTVQVRFIVGMKISGADQEGATGAFTTKPVVVKLLRPDGTPAANVPVFFRPGASAEGFTNTMEIRPGAPVTDRAGEVSARVRLGGQTGEYQIGIEVADPAGGTYMRVKNIRLLAFNAAKVMIAVLGGLALFLFGMKLMGDGLQTVAGESMKRLLQYFARNGLVAVLAGVVVTAVIQSSSATTVMVIGFINAGLLNLRQAIGIIFGANVGTTVTAQIISFNLGAIALPAIIIGFLTTLFRGRLAKGWGQTILGFGLLFFGMTLMSGELKVLGAFPSFIHFFETFDCTPPGPDRLMPIGPVLGALGIGLILTVVVQSSSAAMGIVLALAGSGLINFYTSIPLLLGTNIGTTITALLASLAANRVAKQAAVAHTLFNAFGALLMVALFYVPYGEASTPIFLYWVNAWTPGNAFAADPQNLERHIAMAHTLFNVAVTAVLFPVIPQFAKLCNRLLPVRTRAEAETHPLEPHLLATPSVALEQTVSVIRTMVIESWKMLDTAINKEFLHTDASPEVFADLAEREEKIDATQAAVTDYLVQITRRPLTQPQSNLVPLLMHCCNDAERLADHTENILGLTARLAKSGKTLSDAGRKDIARLWVILDKEARHVIEALGSTEASKVDAALKSERKINKLTDRYENDHIERLRKGNCSLTAGVIFIEMLSELEKIGDKLTNIAERTPEIQKHYIALGGRSGKGM